MGFDVVHPEIRDIPSFTQKLLYCFQGERTEEVINSERIRWGPLRWWDWQRSKEKILDL